MDECRNHGTQVHLEPHAGADGALLAPPAAAGRQVPSVVVIGVEAPFGVPAVGVRVSEAVAVSKSGSHQFPVRCIGSCSESGEPVLAPADCSRMVLRPISSMDGLAHELMVSASSRQSATTGFMSQPPSRACRARCSSRRRRAGYSLDPPSHLRSPAGRPSNLQVVSSGRRQPVMSPTTCRAQLFSGGLSRFRTAAPHCRQRQPQP